MPANNIIRIELSDIRMRAFHGLHPEEKILGNDFLINVQVSFIPPQTIITSIAETPDYSSILDMVREEMATPRELLETLAMEIVAKLHDRFPQLNAINFTITKQNPPLPGAVGNVAVTYSLIS